jgi:cytochrome oxidase Cu insertion factor (SCO1/SenC/PrrC family)
MTVATNPRRNRVLFVGLIAVAVLPLVASYLLYFSVEGAGPTWGTTNQGELLEPMPSAASLRAVDGVPLAGRWWLLLVTEGGCSDECATAVARLRALHVLLNKDADRVRRAVIDVAGAPPRIDDADVAVLAGDASMLRPGIYIVDPLANVVLRYDYPQAGKPVLEDLKKLLKVSHIG